MIVLPKPASQHRVPLATLVCAVLFFLGTADQVFALRIQGVNIRIANLVLAAGLVMWLWTRRAGSTRDITALAIAWLPFLALYGTAAVASEASWLTLLKLSWFAFNFVAAFAWCRLFDPHDVVRGYFAAFLVVSAVIAVDFMSGFTRGPDHMIGFGQPNDLIAGHIVYRPHAFYYEPSYAASGVAAAWALALTPMGRTATTLSTLLIPLGLVALVATLSRTGWLYAFAATVACLLWYGRGLADSRLALSWRKIVATLAITALIGAVLLVPDQNRTRFTMLLQALGWQQTLERVCPIVRDHAAFLDVQCLSHDERLASVGRLQDAVPEQTSEGQRLSSLKESISSVLASPLLGNGVTRGDKRLIEPTASNVWLELAVEGGVLALAAFVWGLGFTLNHWRAFRPENRLIATMLVLYFAVAWPFLQTFPRLDQWLTFWVALTFANSRSTVPLDDGSSSTHPQPLRPSHDASAATGAASSKTRD